jgi:hypothetical protein
VEYKLSLCDFVNKKSQNYKEEIIFRREKERKTMRPIKEGQDS